jgi:hypothetical protein
MKVNITDAQLEVVLTALLLAKGRVVTLGWEEKLANIRQCLYVEAAKPENQTPTKEKLDQLITARREAERMKEERMKEAERVRTTPASAVVPESVLALIPGTPQNKEAKSAAREARG